jgi:hypothetical protein
LYLQALLNAARIVFILSIFVQNQICTRNSFIISTKMNRTMCHMLWPLWLQPIIVYLARIWNESGFIGLLHQVLSLNNVHTNVFRGIHDRIIKTKAMTNNIVTLVTNPVRSHNWGRKLDDDDNNRNISIVICDTDIRSPHFLYEILSKHTYLLTSNLPVDKLEAKVRLKHSPVNLCSLHYMRSCFSETKMLCILT